MRKNVKNYFRSPLAITPPPRTKINVTMYAITFSIFAVSSMHFWLAIEPESILIGGSRNTSHPFVS